jgi:hypothetical protein
LAKDKVLSTGAETEKTAADETASENPASLNGDTEEMVLTYKRDTGEVVSIHKLDSAGGRQELTDEEYAQFFGHGSDGSGNDPSTEAFALGHQQLGFESGYYHGLAEYEAMLTAQSAPAYSPEEEAAYYQGVADYHALVSGQ